MAETPFKRGDIVRVIASNKTAKVKYYFPDLKRVIFDEAIGLRYSFKTDEVELVKKAAAR